MSACMSQPPILSFTETGVSLPEIHQLHAHMLKTGLFHDTFSANKLVAFAVINPDPETLTYAHSIFSRINSPNSHTYNAIIRAYASSPTPQKSLFVFQQMLDGPVCPDKYSFTFALKACAGFGGVEEGRQIHGHVLKIGIGCDLFITNTLIHVYARSGSTQLARNLLDRMPQRDVVSWNALLSAYVERGSVELARQVFDEMDERNVESWNFMISGYLGTGLVEEANEIFYAMPMKNVVSWNAMITGYAHACCFNQVLELFEQMQSEKVKPDNCTLVNVLSACAHVGALSQGEWIHAYIKKNGISISGFLATALIDMYSKCGNIDKALQVFKATMAKDVSTWNSIISGLSIHGLGEHALKVFDEMLGEDCKPNEVTFIIVLSACSRAGLLHEGCNLFDLMARIYKIEPTVEHYGCMVDLLGRVGLLEEAEELVKIISLDQAQVAMESLLAACRNHGDLEMAERVSRRLSKLNPQDSANYVQMSNIYTSVGRWNDAMEVRRRMRVGRVNKKPGCSMIEVNGTIHEFLAGEGIIFE